MSFRELLVDSGQEERAKKNIPVEEHHDIGIIGDALQAFEDTVSADFLGGVVGRRIHKKVGGRNLTVRVRGIELQEGEMRAFFKYKTGGEEWMNLKDLKLLIKDMKGCC